MMDSKRLIFMGTPAFGVPILKRLVEVGYDVVAVVTQPDRPAGRGKRIEASPVATTARELGLNVLQPERVRRAEFVDELRALRPDVIVVAAFGQILPRSILDLAPLGAINVHASLLPALRGAAPIAEAIARGFDATGVTIMLMDEGMDTGAILSQRQVDIKSDDTTESLSDRLSLIGTEFLIETLEKWQAKEVVPHPQDNELATYTRPLSKEDGRLDWAQPAEKLERLCRAYYPWPGCYTYWEGKQVRLSRVTARPTENVDGQPGLVVSILRPEVTGRAQWPAVVTGAGLLVIEELQLEGRRPLTGPEFLRGSRGFVGATFS